MNRRRFLAAVASTGALVAGCVDDAGAPGTGGTDMPPTEDPSTPDDATATLTPTKSTPNASVSIVGVTLQRGLVEPTSPDSIGVQGEDRRFLWAHAAVEDGTVEDATGEEGTVAYEEFTLVAGSNEYAPETERRAYRTGWGSDEAYADGEGWLRFELPLQIDEPDLVLQWPGGEHPLDGALADCLATSPPVMDATLIERYEENPDEPIAVEATNEGDVEGRFVGAINRQGGGIAYAPIERVSIFLEPGETRTVPIADSTRHRTREPGESSPPDMKYDLRWATGSAEATFGDW